MMRITLNGKDTDVADGLTVQALLDELKAPATSVAVERNAQVVPRTAYAHLGLEEGDQIEVVTFVGGG